MSNIKETIIEGEKVYLKRSKYLKEWRVVYPIKNENGTTNWKNFFIGSWGNFIWLVIIIGVIIFASWSYYHDISSFKDYFLNPCKYCYSQVKLFP